MSTPLRRHVMVALRVAVSLMLMAGLGLYMFQTIMRNWEKLAHAHIVPSVIPLLISGVALIAHYVWLSMAWLRITRLCGCALPVKETITIWYMSFLGRYLPGKIWLVSSRVSMYAMAGQSMRKVATATLIDMVYSLHAVVLTLAVCALWYDAILVTTAVAAVGGALVSLLVILHPALLRLVLRRFAHHETSLTDHVLTMRSLALTYASYVSAYIPLTVALCAFARSISDIPWHMAPLLYGGFAAASLTGIVALFAPSGIGVREGALVWILSRSMPQDQAVILTLGIRVWFTVVEAACLPVAAWSLMRLRRAIKARTHARNTPP